MLDAKLIISEDQAVTTTVKGTNCIDVGAYEDALGEEENLRLRVEVSEAFTSGEAGTLTVEAVSDAVSDGIDASSIPFGIAEAIAKATLVVGYCILDVGLPVKHNRYLGTYYTKGGTGTFDTGKLNAYVYAR